MYQIKYNEYKYVNKNKILICYFIFIFLFIFHLYFLLFSFSLEFSKHQIYNLNHRMKFISLEFMRLTWYVYGIAVKEPV